MSNKQGSLECAVICWGIAAAVGVIAMAILYFLAEFSGLQAFFTGGLIGVVLGVVLILFVCRGQKAAADLAADEKPAQRYAREAAEEKAQRDGGAAPAAAEASAPAAAAAAPASESAAAPAAAAASASVVKPSTPLPGEAELAARKGTWKYEAPAAEKKPAKKKPAAKKKAPAKEEAAPAAASGDAPMLYDAPPAEGADDLKLISGVGPKLEQTLNEIGIYRFDQVAAWGPSDIAYVDDRLRFKGRIERDDWMSQAKILAEGGETEFSKRKK